MCGKRRDIDIEMINCVISHCVEICDDGQTRQKTCLAMEPKDIDGAVREHSWKTNIIPLHSSYTICSCTNEQSNKLPNACDCNPIHSKIDVDGSASQGDDAI
ncbi:hypothetical protein BDQ17DRAFT_1336680 [Cyathus striatus]|nr:hypothetical protein BDQ17DRAFT_1336680 [Cyathus striatus]